MIGRIEFLLRRVRNRLSRATWGIRHLGLSPHGAPRNAPGLVLIQIDGLSEVELRRALSRGRLPFIRGLLRKQDYKQHTLYSGLPSCTPPVQAELFYGVRQSIPEFCYYDNICERIFSMFEGDDAREVQGRLEKRGKPLLKGGSAYGDVFTGGADEAHFCMTQLGWSEIVQGAKPTRLSLLFLLHLGSLLRIAVMALAELAVALFDAFRGATELSGLWTELKYIPARVGVCTILREVVVVRASMDLVRGLPIVHMNFLGYDEQSHRRGPDAEFSHWTLKGIDRAVRRVYNAAHASMARDYDVWLYSDHGQTRVQPYEDFAGETLQAAVSRVFDQTVSTARGYPSGMQFQRAKMLRTKRHRPETQPPDRLPIATALGPFGCLYLQTQLTGEQRDAMAWDLVRQAKIPMVFARDGADRATVWTEHGRFTLPADAARVLGSRHRFLKDAAADMVSVARHPQAGDFFICGFRPDGPCITFPNERGSHGGVSDLETGAFAILPRDAPLPEPRREVLRVLDIRSAALTFLRAHTPPSPHRVTRRPAEPFQSLRILTYNVHSCAGMDGNVSPHRIARVIEREQPDIVALQEVDVGRARSAWEDQAAVLARHLEMFHHFHAAVEVEEERYGDAILSRLPMECMRAGPLPNRKTWLFSEPRGALWVSVDVGGGRRVQILNTHFGIRGRERREQADALLGEDWLTHRDCRGPVILCGDFNSSPSSSPYTRLRTRLSDVHDVLVGHKPRGTFSGRFPLQRIDHIFVSRHFEVRHIRVPRTHLALVASDHLPLVVDLKLREPLSVQADGPR